MTCPSGDYAKAVRTIGGLTVEHPYGNGLINIGSEFDYAEWYSLIIRLRTSMEASWKKLQATAAAGDPAKWTTRLKTIGDVVQGVRDRIYALTEPWDFTTIGDIGTNIDSAVTLAIDTACAWQTVDASMIEIGVAPPEHRPTIGEKEGLGIIGTIALGAAGLTIAIGVPLVLRKVLIKS